MLEYKAARYGRTLVKIDRWFPSSKLCSACGAFAESMPLNVREWTCPCGAAHDRDVNAAQIILAAGLAERLNACGDGVRPQRESSRTGRLAVKQETQPATVGIPLLQEGEEVKCGLSGRLPGGLPDGFRSEPWQRSERNPLGSN